MARAENMPKQTFADLKEQELKAKRELIVDAAERVFGVKPFHKVNIRDIAAEAGISHATIYRYFPDQQTLFLEAFLRGFQEILILIDGVFEEKKEAPLIGAIAEVFIDFLTRNDHYFRMMTHFMLDGDLAPALLGKLNAAERVLLDKLEAAFIAGGAQEDTRRLAHSFFAAINGILITFRNYPGRDQQAVSHHMQSLGRIMAKRFS